MQWLYEDAARDGGRGRPCGEGTVRDALRFRPLSLERVHDDRLGAPGLTDFRNCHPSCRKLSPGILRSSSRKAAAKSVRELTAVMKAPSVRPHALQTLDQLHKLADRANSPRGCRVSEIDFGCAS